VDSLQRDDGTYWHPNRDHLVHLVFEYQGKGPLPFITHTVIRRGFDTHHCRHAVVFASNEYPTIVPKHKYYAQLSQSIFRKLWPTPKRVDNPLVDLHLDTEDTEPFEEEIEEKIVDPVVPNSEEKTESTTLETEAITALFEELAILDNSSPVVAVSPPKKTKTAPSRKEDFSSSSESESKISSSLSKEESEKEIKTPEIIAPKPENSENTVIELQDQSDQTKTGESNNPPTLTGVIPAPPPPPPVKIPAIKIPLSPEVKIPLSPEVTKPPPEVKKPKPVVDPGIDSDSDFEIDFQTTKLDKDFAPFARLERPPFHKIFSKLKKQKKEYDNDEDGTTAASDDDDTEEEWMSSFESSEEVEVVVEKKEEEKKEEEKKEEEKKEEEKKGEEKKEEEKKPDLTEEQKKQLESDKKYEKNSRRQKKYSRTC